MHYARIKIHPNEFIVDIDCNDPFKGDWNEPYTIVDLTEDNNRIMDRVMFWTANRIFTQNEIISKEQLTLWYMNNPYDWARMKACLELVEKSIIQIKDQQATE